MPSKISFVPFVLYFRIIVDSVFRSPIGRAGVIALVVHQSWSAAMVCVVAIITDFTLPNGLLFLRGADDKYKVEQFLEQHEGATFVRVPSASFASHFDFSFMIPSYIRPRRFIDYFVKNRLHVFILKRGQTPPPASACAFVSPVAQDVYVFLRDSVDRLTDSARYRITHELGHAAGIFHSVVQRNTIGLVSIYLSILWIVSTFPWTTLVIVWSILQAFLTVVFVRPIFIAWKRREHINAELVADYMALRHLPDDVIDRLVNSGIADRLIHDDEALTESENEERRSIFTSQIAKLQAGEPIDIPEVYMKETFSHSLPLIGFLFLHFAFVVTIPVLYAPTLTGPVVFAVIGLTFYALACWADAILRVRITRSLNAK